MGVIGLEKNGELYYKGRYDPALVEVIREIPGRKWNPKDLSWTFPASMENINKVINFPEIKVSSDAWQAVTQKEEAIIAAQKIKEQEGISIPVREMMINVTPFKHQVDAFNFILHLFRWNEENEEDLLPKGGALLHEQGCGKTLTTIALLGQGVAQGKIKRVLIIAPLSVVSVWDNEIRDKAAFNFRCEVKPLIQSMTKRADELKRFNSESELQVAITNYEGVWREPFFSALSRWNPDLVVCDESQKIKGGDTKQSKSARKLGDKAMYKLILTGTPVTNSPLDFWAQYRFIDPNIFGKSYYAFVNRYAEHGGYYNKEIVGYKNKEELVTKAHSIAHRVSKADALDLPEELTQELYCELESKARKTYNDMVETSTAEIVQEESEGRLNATNVLTRMLRLQQITGGFVPPTEEAEETVQVSSAKLNLLKDVLDNLFVAGDKVVVFTRFVPELQAIKAMLDDTHFSGTGRINYAEIHGGVTNNDRIQAISDFQTDPDCRLILAQIQTAGLGITLHAANKSIFYSYSFDFATYDQCKARLHRIGLQHNVTHIHLIAKNTIDYVVYQALKSKKNMADDLVDNWRKYILKNSPKNH